MQALDEKKSARDNARAMVGLAMPLEVAGLETERRRAEYARTKLGVHDSDSSQGAGHRVECTDLHIEQRGHADAGETGNGGARIEDIALRG